MADFTARDRTYIHGQLVAKMQERFPAWSPDFAAEQANVFLELLEHLAEGLHYNINWAARQAFVEWVQDPGALEQLARIAGYDIPGVEEASTTLTFTLKAARTADVPLAGVRVQTRSGVPFEVPAGSVAKVAAGELTGDASARQVRTRTENFEGTGQPDQTYTCGFTPWLAQSVSVSVGGEAWTRVWTRVADPDVDTGPDAKIFTVRTTSRGRLRIGFGDGVNGLPPALHSPIVVTYEQCLGAIGNVADNTVKEIQGTVLDADDQPVGGITCTNGDPAEGGANGEAPALSRLRIPRYMRTTDATVGADDWVAHAEAVSGVARAKAVTRATHGSEFEPGTVYLYAIPEGGGALTQQQKDDILEAVTATYPHSVALDVLVMDASEGGVVDLEFDGLIVRAGYLADDVKAAIEARLAELFDPKALVSLVDPDAPDAASYIWDFGATVRWTWLVARIQEVAGVDTFDLHEPAGDTVLDFNQFPSLGTVTWS